MKSTLDRANRTPGEDGFEMMLPSDVATSEMGCESGDRAGANLDCCRVDWDAENAAAGIKMALDGHEISDKIQTVGSRADRYCKMGKGDFLGRAARRSSGARG